MKRQFHPRPWLQQSLALSLLLLTVDLAPGFAQPLAQVPPAPVPALNPTGNQAVDQAVQQQINALNRTAALFNTMLAVLCVITAGALIALYLLRQSVLREVTGIVQSHLKEVGDLEGQISSAKQEIKRLLRNYEDYANNLGEDADGFQRDLDSARERFETLLSEASRRQKDTIAALEGHLNTVQQRFGQLESTATGRLSELQTSAEQHRDGVFRALEVMQSGFAGHLTGLETDTRPAQRQRRSVDGRLTG